MTNKNRTSAVDASLPDELLIFGGPHIPLAARCSRILRPTASLVDTGLKSTKKASQRRIVQRQSMIEITPSQVLALLQRYSINRQSTVVALESDEVLVNRNLLAGFIGNQDCDLLYSEAVTR
jgi:hypothetical protein